MPRPRAAVRFFALFPLASALAVPLAAFGTADGLDIKPASRTHRAAPVSTPLAEPLAVYVHDADGTPIAGVPVRFQVQTGGGTLAGSPGGTSVEAFTGPDGRTELGFTLGGIEGDNTHVVTASLEGSTGLPVTFTASTLSEGSKGEGGALTRFTRLSGLVLDATHQPIDGLSVRLFSAPPAEACLGGASAIAETRTERGVFVFEDDDGLEIPGGLLSLAFLDDPAPGANPAWSEACLGFHVFKDFLNPLPQPVFLQRLERTEQAGTLVLTNVAGSSLDCSASGSGCDGLFFFQVPGEQLPAAAADGSFPALAWNIQPPGLAFDPLLPLQLPNVSGLAPGDEAAIYSFDSAVGGFLRTATATVNTDGRVLTAEIGRSGVGYLASPPSPALCALLTIPGQPLCEDGNACTDDELKEAYCACISTVDPNNPCDDGLFCTTADGEWPADCGPGDDPRVCANCGTAGCDDCDSRGRCSGRTITDDTHAPEGFFLAREGRRFTRIPSLDDLKPAVVKDLEELLNQFNEIKSIVESITEPVKKVVDKGCSVEGPDVEVTLSGRPYDECCEELDQIRGGGLLWSENVDISAEVGCFARFAIETPIGDAARAEARFAITPALSFGASQDFSPCGCTSNTLSFRGAGDLGFSGSANVQLAFGLLGASAEVRANGGLEAVLACNNPLCDFGFNCAALPFLEEVERPGADVGKAFKDHCTASFDLRKFACTLTADACFGPVVASGTALLFGGWEWSFEEEIVAKGCERFPTIKL